eukprot:jgi/Galph1/1501/GphlegSOOS_G185.1
MVITRCHMVVSCLFFALMIAYSYIPPNDLIQQANMLGVVRWVFQSPPYWLSLIATISLSMLPDYVLGIGEKRKVQDRRKELLRMLHKYWEARVEQEEPPAPIVYSDQ